jgi:predicted nucleic acid-binding protein
VSGLVAAPELALFEAANSLRRLEMAGEVDPTQAALAHADLVRLPLQTWPYGPLAERVWELRTSVTAYDASYVALAEALNAPLLTLDVRLARAHGPGCMISTPN